MLEHSYARAIVALQQEGKSDAEIVKGLARVLNARGHTRLLPRILRALTSQQARMQKQTTQVLRIAREADAKVFEKEVRNAVSALSGKDSSYDTVVDERIVGGFILETGTKMIDASYRTALVTLYRTITAQR